jgi:hypothetical protein
MAKVALPRFLLIGAVVLNCADAILTVVFVTLFGIAGEANPLCSAVLSRSPVAFLAIKFSLSAALYLLARNHLLDKRVVSLLAVVFCVYLLIVSWFVVGAILVWTT